MSVVVDALGKQCPIPVVMAKKALAELKTPDTLEILVDNEAAVQNLSKLAASCQLPVRAEKTGEKRFSVTMEVSAPVQPAEETICAPDARGDLVVAVGSNCMGNGEEALGKTLMKGFLYAVSQLPTLPKTILFYNSGAYLTCTGSDSLEDLKFMEAQGVEIRTYRVIYECIEEIEAAMKGMLAPKFREKLLGHAEVRQTIRVPSVGTIAGCYITDGKIARSAQIRIVRDGVVIQEDKIASLRRFKDDVKEVAEGYECGVGLERFNDIKEGDVLEAFVMEEIKD